MGKIFERIKKTVTPRQLKDLRAIYYYVQSIGRGRNLNALGKIYGTDKWHGHNYTQHYQFHFDKLKYKPIKLLEIGVGGYLDPLKGGESLRMWKRYFPYGRIFSMDIFDKSFHEESRIKIFRGSQIDTDFLADVVRETGDLDIIIDDGSHLNEHVLISFKFLFPKLKDGGIYIIEDTQSSYWEDMGGDSNDFNNPNTMMTFFKGLTDGLNHEEFIKPGYVKSYYDQKIVSIHFYHNMIFVYKGNNDEKSNLVTNNYRVTEREKHDWEKI